MYLVCISFGGIPKGLSKFPAFSAENKTFNKINGALPKGGRRGRKCRVRLFLKLMCKWPSKASLGDRL